MLSNYVIHDCSAINKPKGLVHPKLKISFQTCKTSVHIYNTKDLFDEIYSKSFLSLH